MIQVLQTSTTEYKPRTEQNARSSDLTVAFAEDFSSLGEKLTKKVAGENYVAIHLSTDPLEAARTLYRNLKSRNGKILNVAGNGIYTLVKFGWSQEKLDKYVFDVIAKVHEHWPIERVISGGQTGVDISGVIAAHALDIDVVATLPKGFKQRGEDHHDFYQTKDDVFNQIESGALRIKSLTHDLVSAKKPRR